ncbi:hypothetical protein QFZ41_002364 [Luteibacter sp. W1I16]
MLARLVAEDVADLAADHALHESIAGDALQRVEIGDLAPVAKDRRGIAEFEDLVEAVRDVDHRLALRAKVAHEAEEYVGLAMRQRAGGFVQGEDLRVAQDRLDDLHHLPLADGKLLQLRAGIEVHAERLEALAGPGQRTAAIDQAEARGQAAEQEVLHDRKLRHVLEFLVDHRHARVDGIGGLAEVLHVSVDRDFPLVGDVLPAEDLHHGRLARAVFAEQAVHAAGAHGEADIAERAHAGEGLPDVAELEARGIRHRQSPMSLRISAALARVMSWPVVKVSCGGVLPFLIHSYMFTEVS